jgi:hypothetical protein
MKTGALVLGILGGVIALIYGMVGYGLGDLGSSLGVKDSGTMKFLSLGLPIAGLVGAGMVKTKAVIGAALMGIAAIGIVLFLGFNFFSLIPVVLLGLGAFLAVLGSREDVKQPA